MSNTQSLRIPSQLDKKTKKIIEQFHRKLKGFHVSSEVTETQFIINYESKTTKGKLEVLLTWT